MGAAERREERAGAAGTGWRGRRLPLSAELSAWTFRLCRPPYAALEWIPDVGALTARTLRGGVPEAGAVLVGSPPSVDPHRPLVEIGGLRGAVPWLSLAVVGPPGTPPSLLAGLLNRMSRRGAVAIPAEPAAPSEIALAVLHAFVPEPDLTGWLGAVGRHLERRPATLAVDDFMAGYLYDPETGWERGGGAPLARRMRLWTLVGRALAAARRIQREPTAPLLAVAHRSGYADHRAMVRALVRAFGVGPAAIRGTVGWEWLMWRFVTGLGEGRGRAWDQ